MVEQAEAFMTLSERIAMAQRHVDDGRRMVERQRAIVARYGWASAILKGFEQAQQIFETELSELTKRTFNAGELLALYPGRNIVDLPACPITTPAKEIYLVRVTTDDREHKLWAASIIPGEEAVRAVLEAVPEGWTASLLARANPEEIEALALELGEVRELPNA